MKPRRKDAPEQSGQKYQMHDSYLITEKISISTHQRGVQLAAHRGLGTCRAGGSLHGSRRHRAAAVAAEEEEEEGDERGRQAGRQGGGEQKEGGGQAATGSRAAGSSSVSRERCPPSSLPPSFPPSRTKGSPRR